ncbi:MAG: hypothetical protein J6S18_02320 [Oscillospiraceae bacterium]|nr:hypothetical protein [Oscillospiraceae bacterium]
MAIKYTGSSGLWTMDAPVFLGGEPDENDGRKVVCWNLAPLRELYPDRQSVVLLVEHGIGERDIIACQTQFGAAGPYENITKMELDAVYSGHHDK